MRRRGGDERSSPCRFSAPDATFMSHLRSIMNASPFARRSACALLLCPLPAASHSQSPLRVTSPDARNIVTVHVRQGPLVYSLTPNEATASLPSRFRFTSLHPPPLP